MRAIVTFESGRTETFEEVVEVHTGYRAGMVAIEQEHTGQTYRYDPSRRAGVCGDELLAIEVQVHL